MDAGVTAGVESFAFFEGEELTVLMAFIGVRIPVEAGSDIAVPISDDLYTRRDAEQRQLRRLRNATIFRFLLRIVSQVTMADTTGAIEIVPRFRAVLRVLCHVPSRHSSS